MQNASAKYVFLIEAERFYKTLRYHWTICAAQSPDQLISWGHATSRELAETAAQNEIKDLSSGLTQGGRVGETRKSAIHRF
jgi:hypothetical protein